MHTTPLVLERVFNASPEQIWHALTDKGAMKIWYFDVSDFKAETGFAFHFSGGSDAKTYKHNCVVDEVVPLKKLSYSWSYEGYAGHSKVSFELFPEGNKTRLKLTHEGLESFPALPDFAVTSFLGGWTHILDKSLKSFLESGQ